MNDIDETSSAHPDTTCQTHPPNKKMRTGTAPSERPLEIPPAMWNGSLPVTAEKICEGVYVIPNFMQQYLCVDPDLVFQQLCEVPEHPSDKAIEFQPSAPCLILGDHKALRYRGRAIHRHKIWAQHKIEDGCLRYGYTGWQWAVALATKDVKSMPWLDALVQKMNSGLEIPHNHWICTVYKDGDDNIGYHHDKMPDVDKNAWIVVLKLGESRRFHFVDPKQGDKVIWERLLPAGTAILMDGVGNSIVKHGVPVDKGVGKSGSIVGRKITTVIPWDKVSQKAQQRTTKGQT